MFPANLHYKTHLLVALQLRLKRKYNVARCTLYGAHPPQLFKAKNSAFIRFSISSDRFFEKSSKNERSRENSSDPFDGINLKKKSVDVYDNLDRFGAAECHHLSAIFAADVEYISRGYRKIDI